MMTAVKGLEFEFFLYTINVGSCRRAAYKGNSFESTIEAKKAAGRNKDLNDLENLPQ
jgi:hypothetical protein